MSISGCNTVVDEHGRELLQHGTAAFPVGCYYDNLGEGPVPWHWHDELEAVVIASGSCTVATGEKRFTLSAGEGFFVNAGILHGCWDLDGSGCRFHSLVFHPRLVGGSPESRFHQDYIDPLIHDPGLQGLLLSPQIPWQKEALDAIETAWQLCSSEELGYEFGVRSSLSRLVWLLCRKHVTADTQPSLRALRDGQRMKRMLEFVHDHYYEPMDTATIAASAAISESECLRCFHATIGTTPIQYVRTHRIRRAAQMLSSTSLRVADIAAQCGIPDVSYFTKTFRQIWGCTPTEFRRQQDKRP